MPWLQRRIPVAPSASVFAHLLALGLLLIAARHRPLAMRPLHLPGTMQGRHMLLTYTTGAPAESSQPNSSHPAMARVPPLKTIPIKTASSQAPPAVTPPGEKGSGVSGDSALGDENVRVALPQLHPHPMPDLSSLPHGVGGDVIVDVAIDETGKVTSTTLVRGLGASIDNAVVGVLRDWTFTPATRNGQNIASEQEIIVHYERG